MTQSIPSGTRPARPAPRAGGARVGGLGLAMMVLVLVVAVIFAANANDVIGWLVVAVSAGWLVFAVIAYLQVRRGVREAARRVDTTVLGMRADAVAALRGGAAPGPVPSAAPAAPAADSMRDTKLDHSFKIVQVQARVVREQLEAGDGLDREMVDRALETIHITAANARDMIKGGDEGPVSGTVVS
ncbi:hypothetical protein [Micrococcus sp.]|uniref:hypothetical protein n=1 Tax=Micrococcus sp. TaxID=1271 RepID=UPI002A9175D2|nr:hypothetical protein [Micrococcus sp.]MDY6054496.1 hypothetical protein [Micrococcus sp.]